MSDRLEEATGESKPQKGLEAWVAGRGRRREFWAWCIPLTVATGALAATGIPGITLVAGIPMLLVWIRRLHDLGFTGWLAPLINIAINVLGYAATAALSEDAAAIAGLLLFLAALTVLGVLPGQRTTNRYGPPTGKAGKLAETFS
jgi:uncharacterized membrane protein YhaH (DUF805 family)